MTAEQQLIRDLLSGKPMAFDTLYKGYREECLMWMIRHHNCDQEEARDLYQITMLIFYENLIQGKLTNFSSSIKTYLFGIAKNKIFELRRAKSKKVNNIHDFVLRAEYSNKEEYETYEGNLQSIESGLNTIDRKCKDLLVLFYYKKKSMVEITESLNYKNTDTTKNMKYKCLQRLKELIASVAPQVS